MNELLGQITTEQLLDVGRKLVELRPLQEVLDTVVQSAAMAMHAETALVILRDRNDGELRVVAVWNDGNSEAPRLTDLSRTLLDEAISKRRPILTGSAVEDPRYAGRSSVILQHIQAVMIVPMFGRSDVEGVIYLDSRSDRDLFCEDNLGPLSTLAAFAAVAIENARLHDTTTREIEALRGRSGSRRGALLGISGAMQELYAMIDRVAGTDLPVFIMGESGTGKELVSREIHRSSPRGGKPFIPVYCGNVPSEIFESELFGHKRGSFTGAVADKPGLVEAANGGTLFLDEVGDIPLALQAKLLRFLQNSEYRAVGDTVVHRADVRIVAATNKDLQKEISEKRFREDLYYRLYILVAHVPPLRERLSDIPLLAGHFLDVGRKSYGGPAALAPEALRLLMSYSWPGNVRELQNTIIRAQVTARGDRIEADDIVHPTMGSSSVAPTDLSWSSAERKHVLDVLNLCEGNKSRAARILGVSRRYMYYKLEQWSRGITTAEPHDPGGREGER